MALIMCRVTSCMIEIETRGATCRSSICRPAGAGVPSAWLGYHSPRRLCPLGSRICCTSHKVASPRSGPRFSFPISSGCLSNAAAWGSNDLSAYIESIIVAWMLLVLSLDREASHVFRIKHELLQELKPWTMAVKHNSANQRTCP